QSGQRRECGMIPTLGAGGLGVVDIGGAPARLPEIMRDCATTPNVIQEFSFYYENPENLSCNFGQLDNLPARDGYLQGRIEQDVNFDLPPGSTVCGVDFQFPTQQMRYDDHMALVYDNIVLASTYNFSDKLMPALDMGIYDWSKIVGSQWIHSPVYEGIFCAGMGDGKSTCVWPETDVLGTIALRYDPIVFQRISSLNPTRTNHQFKMVAIGDNDQNDCEHSPLTFNVRVSYVR
ncbi:MAG: hypothetical protein AAB276_00750, partial [Pseudomonadota bacterium]